jgi:SNF2 family DNA or RNA helicase
MADDMGLGKTLQALCMVRGRTLVVAPTSVLHTWREQVQRFRPALTVQVYHGTQRRIDPDVDITITSYAVMRIDVELLRDQGWDLIILDEAQSIRNPDSQVARAAYTLKAQSKLTLSGTPVENSLHDLWSQFHFLNPGLLGSRRQFEEGIARRVKEGDRQAVQRLRAKVLPFTLRRLKREVAKELPPKTEVVLRCELDAQERAVYEALLGATRAEVAALLTPTQGIFTILEALLRLRQACCHTALLPGQQAVTSSKVELLLESLTTSIEQEHRALVFSQWTSLLDLVEPHLRERGITFGRIDGSTTNRQKIVDAFQRPDGAHVLLLSLKAGGLGLTLTAADHVYIVDPWWNPAVEEQAADRAYRIGQENPVIVHRLVAQNTIEERVLLLQERKRALLTAAVGTSGQVSLSRDEVMELLG